MKICDLSHEIYELALDKGIQKFFPTDGAPFKIQQNFGIHIAGMSYHKPPFEICRPKFDQHSAYFCVEGKGHFYTPAGYGVLEPGEVWLVPAFYPHHYWVEDEWRYIWVHFRNEGHWASWNGLGDRKMRSHRIHQLHRVAEGIIEQSERWDDTEVMENWIHLLISYLRREILEPDDNTRRWAAVLADVWREVRLDPARGWCTRELAEMAHISLPHFNRLVRQVYGITPNAMLSKIRMEKALTLMRGTSLKLEMIAEKTGYSSGFALSKAFRRVFGDSPRRHVNQR